MLNQCKGYDYGRDENGNPFAVERSTGEVTQAVDVTVPVGSKIFTPEDQDRYNQWKAERERKQQEEADKKKRRKTATEFSLLPLRQK